MNKTSGPRPDQPTIQIDWSQGIPDDGPSQLLQALDKRANTYKEYCRSAAHPDAIVHPDGVIELLY